MFEPNLQLELAASIIPFVLSTIFAFLHIVNEIRIRKLPRSSGPIVKKSWGVRKSILLYNFFILTLSIYILTFTSFATTNKMWCLGFITSMRFGYNFGNYLLYNVLIAKNVLVETGNTSVIRLRNIIWYYLNFLWAPMFILLVVVGGIINNTTRIIEVNGQTQCTAFAKWYSLLVILTTDTVVSLLLLGLFAYSLAYPLCEESRERNKPIIRRTVAWSIVAISSTFVFLLSVLIFNSLPENRTNVNSLLVTMNIDILLNTLSINMTWDIRYYRKAIDWLCHFPSVQKKDNIKVDHDEKRAKISSVASLNGIAGSINLRDTLQDRSESVV
mmetsp:Transcript_42431/g.68886  ORF Transcript_42431/g.68886 Transcript_42431/m.68886 type:complete len:329 (-) Transcript_42431:487-1473(-)